MKQHSFNISQNKLLILFFFVTIIAGIACSKTKSCEEHNTFTLIVKNTLANGTLTFNVDKDFTSINAPGDYSADPGESVSIIITEGEHVIKAKSIVTVCSGGRCSTTVTSKADKTVNQSSCTETTLVY